MRIHCTQKLVKRIKAVIRNGLGTSPLPLEWYAGIFYSNRKPYVLATETSTLATIIFSAKGITSSQKLSQEIHNSIKNLFYRKGWSILLKNHISIDISETEILQCNNRQLTGSITELMRLAKWDITDGNYNLETIIDRLNETPMSFINMDAPTWLLNKLTKLASEINHNLSS